ncbi:MAG: cyclic nucleotide-binding domain-containing protein [Anaerolineae bacterium]|jgi:CRP/FNR family cyclic AMP-dependent transcriptional regulator|nr:cyclic nucleotide-binding domain-containing protein [Anaerolineae bacterium]
MQQSISAILSVTDIFDTFTETQLQLVAALCESQTYQTGDVLLRENDQTTEMYVIARGGVEVIMNPTFVSNDVTEGEMVVLTELRQGQVFGEVALVDQGMRSATIRVSQANTVLLRIARKRLMQLCDTYPELGYKLMKNLAADLAFKIRNTDLTIRQYQLMLSQSKLDAS